MQGQILRESVAELFKFVPGESRIISVVAETRQDEIGLRVAEGVITKFARFNKKQVIKSPDNEMMIVEGAPFSERLDFIADKLDLRTFNYITKGESEEEYRENLRSVQEDVIRHMVGENGVLIAFPKSKCPKMIVPMKEIETMKYRSWGAVAMAIKLRVPVFIYVPAIQDPSQFLGPMVSRGKILCKGDWGAWISATGSGQDSREEGVRIVEKMTGDQPGTWVEGVPMRPNWITQN